MNDVIETRPSNKRLGSSILHRQHSLLDAFEMAQPQLLSYGGVQLQALQLGTKPLLVSQRRSLGVHGGGQSSAYGTDIGSVFALAGSLSTSSAAAVLLSVGLPTSSAEFATEDGEFPADVWSRWTETTQSVLKPAASEAKRPSTAAARLRVERLVEIQAILGLPIQEIAQVLGITRQGLYKWLDASKDVRLQEASRERLALVERIARLWRQRTSTPMSSVAHEPLIAGGTIFHLLVAEAIDEAAAMSAIDELIEKLQGRKKSRSQNLVAAGFTRRPSPGALPSDE